MWKKATKDIVVLEQSQTSTTPFCVWIDEDRRPRHRIGHLCWLPRALWLTNSALLIMLSVVHLLCSLLLAQIMKRKKREYVRIQCNINILLENINEIEEFFNTFCYGLKSQKFWWEFGFNINELIIWRGSFFSCFVFQFS